MPWLAQKVAEKARFTMWVDPKTGEKWDFRLWLIWAARHGFIYIWPRYGYPTGGMIARPITHYMLDNWQSYEPEDLLYQFDPDGDGAWVDFLWAPGQQLEAASQLEKSGIKWVGWQHRVTSAMHTKTIKEVSKMIALGDRKASPIRLV